MYIDFAAANSGSKNSSEPTNQENFARKFRYHNLYQWVSLHGFSKE
jgi:hypothetical protein